MVEDAHVSAEAVGMRVCPGCGAHFERRPWALDRDLCASPECWHAYGEITMFVADHLPVLGRLRQLALDAYGAQHVGDPTPAALVAHSLVGLHLALVEGSDDEAVRAVHERMRAVRTAWPSFGPPPAPRAVTVADVLRDGARAESVEGHETSVRRWAEEVWQSWAHRHEDVADLARRM
ncbi:MAG: hypothetical protein QG622_1903 [Actinomycetota bacterium]|nr:hypothetical protein [Actinomycetota bacterium]